MSPDGIFRGLADSNFAAPRVNHERRKRREVARESAIPAGVEGSQSSWRPSFDTERVRQVWNLTDRVMTAIATRDAETIAKAYAGFAHCENPLLGTFSGPAIGKAWRAVLARKPDYRFCFSILQAGPNHAEVEWELNYPHPSTGRDIRIQGLTMLSISDGCILQHRDQLSLRAWSRRALGWKGWLLAFIPGWRLFVEDTLRAKLRIAFADEG